MARISEIEGVGGTSEMMGKTHMTVATAIYCVYQMPHAIHDVPLWGEGAGVALFTSLIPDIDEPRSRIGGMIMPIIPSWLRPLAFLLAGGYLGYWGWTLQYWMVFAIGLFLMFMVMIKHRESPTHGLIGFILVASLIYTYDPKLLIPALIGYGSHLVCDLFTEGIGLFWPIPGRIRLTIMHTNSLLERWVVFRGGQLVILWMIVQSFKPTVENLFFFVKGVI